MGSSLTGSYIACFTHSEAALSDAHTRIASLLTISMAVHCSISGGTGAATGSRHMSQHGRRRRKSQQYIQSVSSLDNPFPLSIPD